MTIVDHATNMHEEHEFSADAPFSKNRKRLFYIGLVLVSLSLIFGLTTYLILTGLTPIQPRHSVVVTVLLINSLLIASMILLIAWHVYELWMNRLSGKAGAKLHVRFVSQFSIVAALPAILLAIFASISLDRGLDHLFSTHTKALVRDSLDGADFVCLGRWKDDDSTILGCTQRTGLRFLIGIWCATALGYQLAILLDQIKTWQSTQRRLKLQHFCNFLWLF